MTPASKSNFGFVLQARDEFFTFFGSFYKKCAKMPLLGFGMSKNIPALFLNAPPGKVCTPPPRSSIFGVNFPAMGKNPATLAFSLTLVRLPEIPN